MFNQFLNKQLNTISLAAGLLVLFASGLALAGCPDSKASFSEAQTAMKTFNKDIQPDLVESGTKVWRVQIKEDRCQNQIILADTTPIFGAKAPTKIGNVKVVYRISLNAPSQADLQ